MIGRIFHTGKIKHEYEIVAFKDRSHVRSLKRLDICMHESKLFQPDTTNTEGCIDVTVTNSIRSTLKWMESAQPNDNVLQLADDDDIVLPNHSQCATNVGLSAKKAEQTKFRKYSEIAKTFNKDIYPMGFESQGTWGPGTHQVFNGLMKRINEINNPDQLSVQTKSHYWRLHLSFVLHKYVARHCIDAFASIPLPSIIDHPTPQYNLE